SISDSRRGRAIELLRAIGFAVEPALPQPSADASLRLVWIDSDRLHCGGRAGSLPTREPLLIGGRIASLGNVVPLEVGEIRWARIVVRRVLWRPCCRLARSASRSV